MINELENKAFCAEQGDKLVEALTDKSVNAISPNVRVIAIKLLNRVMMWEEHPDQLSERYKEQIEQHVKDIYLMVESARYELTYIKETNNGIY